MPLTPTNNMDASQPVKAPAALDSQEMEKAKQRILVMDDDEAVCEIASQMLEHLGYEVSLAVDGDQAVDMFLEAREQNQSYDAVILDLTIPDGPGAQETIRRLEAIDPKVVALVSSGYFDDPAMREFEEHGFRGAITKPFRIKALSGILKHAIQAKSGAVSLTC